MNNDIKIEIESRFGFQEGQIPTEIQHLQMVSFRNGAEWMRERLIEKACEWLAERLQCECHPYNGSGLVEEYRKAMTE